MSRVQPKVVTKSGDRIAEYLTGLGVQFDEADLVAPDISAIQVQGINPSLWLDKHGNPVPANIELYMVDTSMGPVAAAAAIAAKKVELFTQLPPGHGFHWAGRPGRAEIEVVLMRTAEQRAVYEAARKAKPKRVEKQAHAIDGVGTILTETHVEDLMTRRPSL